MAKLKDIKISAKNGEESIKIETTVNVTKDGLFTTTLPDEAVKVLEEYGISLKPNRVGRSGYFEAKALDEIILQIHTILNEALSRELIEEKLVIKYQVRTRACYALDYDNEIIPNGYWRKDGSSYGTGDPKFYNTNWREGNTNNQSVDGVTPGISVYARVYKKQTFSYKSGKQVSSYEFYKPKDKRGSSVDWINSLSRIRAESTWDARNGNLSEVDATEENARLFVELFKFIFKANELLKDLKEPENIIQMAANIVKALPLLNTEEK